MAALLVQSMPKNKYGSFHLSYVDVGRAGDAPPVQAPLAGAVWGMPEFRPLPPVTPDIWQARDVMSLQAAMQWRSRQLEDGRLQGMKVIDQWQQPAAPKRYDHHLLCLGQLGGS